MAKRFRKILASLLASTVIASAGVTGASAAKSAQTQAPEAPASVSEPQAAPQTVNVAKEVEIPSVHYRYRITNYDDYIAAVKATGASNQAIKETIRNAENYVDYVDNSKLKYFPEVDSQGGVGSCCSWSVVYYQFTHAVNKMLDRAATRETTFQPVFVHNLFAGGSYRGDMAWVISEILNTAGCATFSTVSDTQADKTWNASYDVWKEAHNYRVSSYMDYENIGRINSRITSPDDPDLAALKATVRNGDLISFTCFISSFVRQPIVAAPGVDSELVGKEIVTKTSGTKGCHEMTIVGYNDNIWTDLNKNGKVDEGEMGAFKIVNSWGKDQLNGGFLWVAYDALNQQSVVDGVAYDKSRVVTMYDFVKLNVSPNYKFSNIYLKYTLNSSNRADSYLEITAMNKFDGTTYRRKTVPYCAVSLSSSEHQSRNYEGNNEGKLCDATMIVDLDNVVKGLDSNTFNDYYWNVKFVDNGADTTALTVKDICIFDETTGKTYDFDSQLPIEVNKSSANVSLKDYYNINKISMPAASSLTVGSEIKFTFKTANETFGSSPIKYTMTVSKDGKQLLSKLHKASTVNKTEGYSVIKGTYKPTATGTYTVSITGMDASGQVATRSAQFRVYNKQLAVRSIELDKGKYIGQYETLKITPVVTGGKAPYTYSYYYEKDKKTYTIAANVKSSSKTKKFGANTGNYKLIVKVKDAEGKTAQATQYVVVSKTKITRIIYNNDYAQAGNWVYVRANVSNRAQSIKENEYIYTVEKDGKTETLEYCDPNWPEQAVWKPKENGQYKITVTVKYGDKILDTMSETYDLGASIKLGKRAITVNVISYLCNETNSANYQLHYWGGPSGIGDVNCVAENKTVTKNVGFWTTSQTFRQYTAYIPDDATGYKFHIGNRWFPDGVAEGDGDTQTSNTVYVFNYDFDRCLYTME